MNQPPTIVYTAPSRFSDLTDVIREQISFVRLEPLEQARTIQGRADGAEANIPTVCISR
jgi:hypothetical protein